MRKEKLPTEEELLKIFKIGSLEQLDMIINDSDFIN